MIRPTRLMTMVLLGASLAGCAAAGAPPPRTSTVKLPPATRPSGVDDSTLTGRSAEAVSRLFGPARLDVSDGPGRKLQFVGAACVLDVYFYAKRKGSDAVATHADARTPDGRTAEVESCINALRR